MVDGYRISVGEDENVLEIDGGDGCMTMRKKVLNATELGTSASLKW